MGRPSRQKQSMLNNVEPDELLGRDLPIPPQISDQMAEDANPEEAEESAEGSSSSGVEATAAELERWDRFGFSADPDAPSIHTSAGAAGTNRQTRDADGPTSSTSGASRTSRSTGYIDPTAGLSSADSQYLRNVPSMDHVITMVELHNWETPPDAAFTMACAGLLRECLQDEGHTMESINAFAGEMLTQAQQQPLTGGTAAAEVNPASSSTRSRSRTPARTTGRDDAQIFLQTFGLSQAVDLLLIHEQTEHLISRGAGRCMFTTHLRTHLHAFHCFGCVDLQAFLRFTSSIVNDFSDGG